MQHSNAGPFVTCALVIRHLTNMSTERAFKQSATTATVKFRSSCAASRAACFIVSDSFESPTLCRINANSSGDSQPRTVEGFPFLVLGLGAHHAPKHGAISTPLHDLNWRRGKKEKKLRCELFVTKEEFKSLVYSNY